MALPAVLLGLRDRGAAAGPPPRLHRRQHRLGRARFPGRPGAGRRTQPRPRLPGRGRLQPVEHPPRGRDRRRGHGRGLSHRGGARPRPGCRHELPGDAGRKPRAPLRRGGGGRAGHPALGRGVPPSAEPGRPHEREGDRPLRRGRPPDGLLLPLRRRLDVRRLPRPGAGQAGPLHGGRGLLGRAAAVHLPLEHDRDGPALRGRARAPRRLLHEGHAAAAPRRHPGRGDLEPRHVALDRRLGRRGLRHLLRARAGSDARGRPVGRLRLEGVRARPRRDRPCCSR